MQNLIRAGTLTMLVMAGMLTGCGRSPDERLQQMAQQSLDAQARQNDRMVQQNQQVIEASKELVAADARARTEMTELQHDMQTDQREIGRQRDSLEQERRQIAAERSREHLVSTTVLTIGTLLVAGLPLLVGIYLLRAVQQPETSDGRLAEVLFEELQAEKPPLLTQSAADLLERPSIREDGGKEGGD